MYLIYYEEDDLYGMTEILKRGVRADENIHGHGIGMVVASELVGLLGGVRRQKAKR